MLRCDLSVFEYSRFISRYPNTLAAPKSPSQINSKALAGGIGDRTARESRRDPKVVSSPTRRRLNPPSDKGRTLGVALMCQGHRAAKKKRCVKVHCVFENVALPSLSTLAPPCWEIKVAASLSPYDKQLITTLERLQREGRNPTLSIPRV